MMMMMMIIIIIIIKEKQAREATQPYCEINKFKLTEPFLTTNQTL
jgi:hypothetical protein